MLAVDKALLLSGFLGGLPDAVALRLAKAVEVDRLAGGKSIPHDVILAALRPQLRTAARAKRMPTPLRYFCVPFEDLLFDAPRTEKQKGRIARSSITPVWEWLAGELIPEEHARLTSALREAMLKDNEHTIREACELLWSSAGTAIQAVMRNEKRRAAVRQTFGAQVVEDAAEMGLMLSAAHDIVALQAKLPRPIPLLTEDIIAAARDAYDKLSASAPDVAPYVVLMIMPRLERIWEGFRLIGAISRQSTDTLVANTDLGIVGDLLFADLESHVAMIKAIRPNEYDNKGLIEKLSAFSELSSGMAKELGIRREGKWGQRLSKSRADVSRLMETLLERAPKDIAAGLPQPKAGGSRGARHLDIMRATDPDRIARAVRAATLLMDAKPYANAASYTAKLNEATDECGALLREAGEDILKEMRTATPEERAAAERHLTVLFDLCNHVLGEEETDLLRRRSKVAANAA